MQYLPYRIFVDPVHFVKLGIFNSNLQVSELIHYCFRFAFAILSTNQIQD